jgi:formylglycine-generating enzyme required for sulfatase activity
LWCHSKNYFFAYIGEMRKAEKQRANKNESPESADSDLFQTTTDEDVHVEPPPPPTPAIEVTTTKVTADQRVEGWTPTAKGLLVVCLVLVVLLLSVVAGIFWYGKEHYRKACDKIITQNKQMLEERGGTEYVGLKGELEKGNYKEVYKPLWEMVKREKAEIVAEGRKAAEVAFALKQAEEAALERKKAEEAEAARIRVEAEKLKKAEQQAAELKRQEEEARKKVADAEAEQERKKVEAIAAERKRLEELELKKVENAVAERKRLEEMQRKKAEALVIARKRAEEEDILQNSGFDSQLYMVVDLSGGASAAQYPIAYHKTESDVPGGVQDEAYKTTKLLLRYIAPGTFMMGSPKDQLGYDETQPPTKMPVTNGFFIGVFEVTQKQWELVMGTNPSYFEDASASASRPVEQVSCYEIRENALTNKHDPNSNWPANQYVSEKSFMGRLRMKTGIRSFDLPTEIQWEYACRAGTTTALNSGKNITNMYIDPNVAEVGRYYSNGGRGYKRDGTTLIMTAPVGSYKPNACGLYDMHGNVSEWCLDWRRLHNVVEPKWKGSVVEQYSVLRGGGWDNVAWHCLSTSRVISKPFQRNYNAGFRVIRNKSYSFSSTVSSR